MVSILLGGFLYYLNLEFSSGHKGMLFYNKGPSVNLIFLCIICKFFKNMIIFNRIVVIVNKTEYNNINIVIGTTGLTDEQIENLKQLSNENQVACFIAPNFSTGAVLMMKFAQMAAKYFDNAEIIELHHNQKKDAPSGTAVKTAQLMASENKSFVSGNCQEVETISGARGAESYSNIHIHSIRMPGFMASQEVLFGSDGQTLSIRHDSTNRSCYMPGVLMAIKYAFENKNFTYGLDNIL